MTRTQSIYGSIVENLPCLSAPSKNKIFEWNKTVKLFKLLEI